MRTLSLHTTPARRAAGFTLIELMVAMLLGLIVIAGVASVFLANVRSYRSNTALSDVQSNARIAYAMLARDIRQAGLTGCNSQSGRLTNVLKNGPYGGGAQEWWANWALNTVHGYDEGQVDPAVAVGAATGQRVAGTDSLQLLGVKGQGGAVHSADTAAAAFTMAGTDPAVSAGDLAMVCDLDHAALFQVTAAAGSPLVINHVANSGVPGNCSAGLGYPSACGGTASVYPYNLNAVVSAVTAKDWYIGNNPAGGRSLYRVALVNQGGALVPEAQEMVRGVTNMQVTYHAGGGGTYQAAQFVGNWGTVDAVRVTLTLESQDQRASTDQEPLRRVFSTTTTIRNRVN